MSGSQPTVRRILLSALAALTIGLGAVILIAGFSDSFPLRLLQALAIFGAGAVIGELSMIDGAPRSASVTALRDAKLQFVSRPSFDAFGADNPDVYKHLVALLAGRLRDTNGALIATSFLSVKGRVARALLNLSDAFGHDVGNGRILVRQKVTQNDLAAMAGIARENVSRILNEWVRDKLVCRLSGYYCLEDKARLERETAI